MRIIYNDGNINNDVIGLLQYINDFTKSIGVQGVIIDDQTIYSILNGMRSDFPHIAGIDASSVFKKLGNFLTYFIAQNPILSTFPPTAVGEELANIRNHQNVIVGLHVVFDNLQGASIDRGDGSHLTIRNRVQLSKHSYVDLVDALKDVTPSGHFHLVTVLLEQLVYKSNPDLQYELLDL